MRILSCLLPLFCALAAGAEPLHLTTENDPPHNMLRGEMVVGSSTDKLREALRQAKVDYTVELMPWARAYQYALDKPGYCVFSTARTAERESRFDWVGPLDSMDWVMYGRADDARHPGNLDAVREAIIGGYNQDVISNWLVAQHFRVEAAPEDGVNLRKLRLGRIDFWASSKPRAMALLAADPGGIVPRFTFGHTDLYLACHPGMPVAQLRQLNAVLDQMRHDGAFARIDAQYP